MLIWLNQIKKKSFNLDIGSVFLNISIVKIKQIQCQKIISLSYENLGGEFLQKN